MKVVATGMPERSILNRGGTRYDYIDSYSVALIDTHDKLTPIGAGRAFFGVMPNWVKFLLALRDKIVAPFGLKTGDDINADGAGADGESESCKPGDHLGFFEVYEVADDEVILGEDDSHLNFRVSILLKRDGQNPQQKTVSVTTVVMFNNWFGRLYFIPVRPFHKIIVRAMMKRNFARYERELNAG